MPVITAVLKYEKSRKHPRKFESLPDAHRAFGQNARQYIHDKQRETIHYKLTVSEVAYALGLEHSRSFSKLFKTETNRSHWNSENPSIKR
jgi:AraC-like DNA-binding protein